jgi:hypothetical protein
MARSFNWERFIRETFRDSLNLSIALIFVQAVATAIDKGLGLAVFAVITIYTIGALFYEIHEIGTSDNMREFLKALAVLLVDLIVLAIFWSV